MSAMRERVQLRERDAVVVLLGLSPMIEVFFEFDFVPFAHIFEPRQPVSVGRFARDDIVAPSPFTSKAYICEPPASEN